MRLAPAQVGVRISDKIRGNFINIQTPNNCPRNGEINILEIIDVIDVIDIIAIIDMIANLPKSTFISSMGRHYLLRA